MNKTNHLAVTLLGTICGISLLASCSQLNTNPGANLPEPSMKPPEQTEPANISKTPTDVPATPGPTDVLNFPPAEVSPVIPEPESSIDPTMETLIKTAKADLAKRLGLSEDDIDVLEAKAMLWPDGSLGCPQPGMAYIQIPFEGGLIRLEAGGQEYDYHTGEGESPFLCVQASK